ncbi:hypothetical protein F4821DRAFT_110805 [Hypoxylon rubiginosum]|uniref:Uncharacterized protein n=1 Tax=Hypoxylon rubiginosum TaxID=110542 RepID=A0ACC0DKP2_9PEZI|nr:hypothetical protein F4821DRAFT_110805 [Hypoxylon rubiginosum]
MLRGDTRLWECRASLLCFVLAEASHSYCHPPLFPKGVSTAGTWQPLTKEKWSVIIPKLTMLTITNCHISMSRSRYDMGS